MQLAIAAWPAVVASYLGVSDLIGEFLGVEIVGIDPKNVWNALVTKIIWQSWCLGVFSNR